jgi:hypothetical protein
MYHTLTLEKIKEIVESDKDIILLVDGLMIEEIDEDDMMFYLEGVEQVAIDEDSLSSIELYTFKELEFTLENVFKAYKEEIREPQDKWSRKVVALTEWNSIENDIEEKIMFNGCHSIDRIVELKEIKDIKKL